MKILRQSQNKVTSVRKKLKKIYKVHQRRTRKKVNKKVRKMKRLNWLLTSDFTPLWKHSSNKQFFSTIFKDTKTIISLASSLYSQFPFFITQFFAYYANLKEKTWSNKLILILYFSKTFTNFFRHSKIHKFSNLCSQIYFIYNAELKEISITPNKKILETLSNPSLQDGETRQVLPKW